VRYLLMICVDPATASPADPAGSGGPGSDEPTVDWVTEMDRRGVRLAGSVLRPSDEATTVRVRDGETLLSDGPFAETKEEIVGFDLIECADLDEALEVARRHPVAGFGAVEVRALFAD